MKNRNKKSDNFSDLIASRKKNTAADIGEFFKSVDTGKPSFKNAIGDIKTLASEEFVNNALPVVDGVTITGAGTTLDPLVSAGGGSGTTTIVNITSAQLKSELSTGGIQLVASPGAGKYFDVEKVVLEFTYIAPAYTTTEIYLYVNGVSPYPSDRLTGTANSVTVLRGSSSYADVIEGVAYSNQLEEDSAILLEGWNGDNFVTGNGTLRAIITYTVRTFGA